MALRPKTKGEINDSESQIWVGNTGVVYSSAAELSLWCRDTHLSSITGVMPPLCEIPWNWVMWFPGPHQKLLARPHTGISPLTARRASEQKEKQIRSSAESFPHVLRWVLMITGMLVWLGADSVQAHLHCAPSALQSHLSCCQCLIIPPFPS